MSQPRVADILASARKKLEAAGIDNPHTDARLMLQHASGLSHSQIIADPDQELDASVVASFDAALVRRLAREPVSKIVGSREFWSLEFIVTPDVLDPRPDSETLIEAVLGEVGTCCWTHAPAPSQPASQHSSPVSVQAVLDDRGVCN